MLSKQFEIRSFLGFEVVRTLHLSGRVGELGLLQLDLQLLLSGYQDLVEQLCL